jgi:hypothetical protein
VIVKEFIAMPTDIYQFEGKDIWVRADLDSYGTVWIRIERICDDGTVIFNGWLNDDYTDDIDEILYGELTEDIDSIEIHPLDTITTDELIAMVEES